MNDIEKQIEGEYELDKEEEENIKNKINYKKNNNRTVIYIVIGVLMVLTILLLVYIFVGRNNNLSMNDINDNIVDNDNTEEVNKNEESIISYVSCDDNTALLNVRNSTSGDIIDGLSCYKEVVIEEEIGSTDNCDNWYRISYDKNGSNYTGYACGTYIKKLEIDKSILVNSRNLIDKATSYYEGNVIKPYCGNTSGSRVIDFKDNMTGEYIKSEYKNINELKNYLLSFLDEKLINTKMELSDINNPKYYDNYDEIDGELYCRNYSGKGYVTYYTGNYDIEVVNYNENNIYLNIVYQYVNYDSNCNIDDISKCGRNDFIYEIGNVNIENGVITKIDFHK